MLAAEHRLRSRREFSAVVRRGQRCARGGVVVHSLRSGDGAPVRVGLVVSKAVGGSVVRHRVSRRIREAIRPLVEDVTPGTSIVVRALPSSSSAPMASLRTDIESALVRMSLLGTRT